MKSFGLFCLCLAWAATAHAELDSLWTRQLELSVASNAVDVAIVLQNGETMIASAHISEAVVDLWRLTPTGRTVWQGSIAVPQPNFAILGLAQMDEGHVIALCAFQGDMDQIPTLYLKGFSLTGTVLWEQGYPYDGIHYDAGFKKLSDNTVAAYISTYSTVEFNRARLIKFDSEGDTLWTRIVGPDGIEIFARDLAELPNGDIALVGHLSDETSGFAGYVMRVSPEGDPIWTNIYRDDVNSGLTSTCIDVNASGNILVGGVLGNFWLFYKPWAKSLTGAGEDIWTLTGMDDEDFGINGIRFTPDDGAVMVGSTRPNFGFFTAKVASADVFGAGLLEFEYAGSMSSFIGLSSSGSGDAVAYGSFANIDSLLYRGVVLRFGHGTAVTGFVREQGSNNPVDRARIELQETGEFALTDEQGIYSLYVSQPNGTLRVSSPCITPTQQIVELVEGEDNVVNFSVGVPRYESESSSLNMVATFGIAERDTFEVSNSGNGDLTFSTTVHEQTPTYGWLSASPASGVIQPGESAQIIVTVFAIAEHPASEFFGEVRVHHNSCPDTVNEVGVFALALGSPNEPSLVGSFAMHPAYPNPFNNTVRVAFDLPQSAQVNAKLYSIDGREAATLANGQYTAGRHELSIAGDALATGVYLLRLTAGSAVATQKLVLLK